MGPTDNLELYYRNFCGYSRKVLDYMEEHGITMTTHCLQTEEGAEQRLVELGGKAQVPCLIIDGKALYESDDIIAYLAETFVKG
ncbi:MAG: glutathione S-transferase N-terminal domain-containing protein [Atopobiaceae bacterium]|nr:glutathione S-transferase N-terminal domain-containing protein [Atopobiaceae bacterium]